MLQKIKRKLYIKKLLKREKDYTFEDIKLKYLFIEEQKSDELIVVFSGFPGNGKPANYNYISTLKNVKKNKLFILDNFGFDGRGAYYLGLNGNMIIERATTSLINKIKKEYKIKKIISIGSSKGGFAALYFGFKHSFQKIIVAEPQIILGTYLNTNEHKYILEYIEGEVNDKTIYRLNNLLLDLIKTSDATPIVYVNFGEGSYYYKEHICYLEELLKNKNIDLFLKADNYSDHNELIKFYPEYLLEVLTK
ncbi:hypothetical protein VBG40_12420 [Vagococcus fluvialis]|uniref:hypothetical protein n=1 Tax=Vagococcus fluvialis TaxID=2738 RepID=UPI0037A79FD2